MTEENKEKLFAEIKDQEIRYAVFQSEENLNYKLILKKNSNNLGIKQGVIIDLNLASEIVSQDLREIEKKLGKTFSNINLIVNQREMSSTCLLYTSPSPRDLSTSRMPSSA